MSSSPAPTGRREDRHGSPFLVLERSLPLDAEQSWAAVTDPARLESWIGTWSGDPASGSVVFTMTAEGADVPDETVRIDVCEAPRRFAVRVQAPDDPGTTWHWELDLDEGEGATTVRFAQQVLDAESAASIGPGWEYYLDRMVASETGGPDEVAAIDFDDYYPAQAEHYRSLLG